jgi:hypothetical protein
MTAPDPVTTGNHAPMPASTPDCTSNPSRTILNSGNTLTAALPVSHLLAIF